MDGEFSVTKTALHRYMIRSDINSPEYLEVKDSSSLQMFGSRFLSTPGSNAQLKSRHFIDLLPEVVLARKSSTEGEGGTLDGISTRFQYICSVRYIV